MCEDTSVANDEPSAPLEYDIIVVKYNGNCDYYEDCLGECGGFADAGRAVGR